MNLTLYLIDDEPHALDVLKTYVAQTEGLTLAGTETNPLRALEAILTQEPDLVLADIDMPQLNGLALAGLLPPNQKLVYTTSFREYGPEAYERKALDYLLKPISYDHFLRSVMRARESITTTTRPAPVEWYIRTGPRGNLRRIQISEILYLETSQHYLNVHLAQERLLTYMTVCR